MYRVSKQVLGKNLAKKSHKTFDEFFDKLFMTSIWRFFWQNIREINLTNFLIKYIFVTLIRRIFWRNIREFNLTNFFDKIFWYQFDNSFYKILNLIWRIFRQNYSFAYSIWDFHYWKVIKLFKLKARAKVKMLENLWILKRYGRNKPRKITQCL